MNNSEEMKWWVDASFGTRYELRNQTGATLSLGIGCAYNSMARKQKLNTTSSTEAEIVGCVHDAMSQKSSGLDTLYWRRVSKCPEISFFRKIKAQSSFIVMVPCQAPEIQDISTSDNLY
jgi:hypothetical protein